MCLVREPSVLEKLDVCLGMIEVDWVVRVLQKLKAEGEKNLVGGTRSDQKV